MTSSCISHLVELVEPAEPTQTAPVPNPDAIGVPTFRCGHEKSDANTRITKACIACGHASEAKWRKSPHGKAVKKRLAKKAQIRVRELEARVAELEASHGGH